eukprot:g44929.t1
MISKFADDTNIGYVVDSEEGYLRIQQDLDQMSQWTEEWRMEFNLDKCEVLHVGKANKGRIYTLNGINLYDLYDDMNPDTIATRLLLDEMDVIRLKHVQLETLRDDLELYYKLLKTAMVELINKDYADFVNLSTNLVGMDRALKQLTVPLGQLREEVMSLKLAVSEGIQAIDDRLLKEDDIRKKK